MPLKIVSVRKSQNLYLRGTVSGQSVFESTGTSDKRIAEEIRRKREAELWQETIYGKRAVITFAEALSSFLTARPQSRATIAYYQRLLPHLGMHRLSEIDQNVLESLYPLVLRDGHDASPATKKRAIRTPVQAVLEFGAIRKWCDRPAFEVIPIIKRPRKFLRPEEATRLVEAAAPHLQPLLVFLLATGCRMSEALDLEWRQVDLRGRRAVVWQKQARERHVDLPPVAYEWLSSLPYRDGYIFRPLVRTRYGMDLGKRYQDTGRQYGGQIKAGWSGACHRAGLPGHVREWVPRGQKTARRFFVPDHTPHCLRHTWATWHYCVHKDLLRLQADGDWSEIKTVTGYAKLMPDAYRDEIVRWWSYGPEIPRSDP
ncbi:tyrosine-type recombinase/integrase [Gluconacetobacter entanii]|uniref:Integrase n=1 Tax=Gluconacetobacter entanii TaxID=108528 RepID=A0A318Q8V4_9PROT|nr:tyrosine-type recombinase/integrase [Gluconacetobacter entanii]MCE2578096.1 tyrosine-type recombinase/integrase [Komagataeibacter sp. FNDCR1]PYD62287.1 integrase [Gluconacetobacter entanii]